MKTLHWLALLCAITVGAPAAPLKQPIGTSVPSRPAVTNHSAAPAVPRTSAHEQPTGYNTGMPFGLIGRNDLDHLESYAKKNSVDLMGDMRRAYENDEEALKRVFAFSLKFTKLNRDARTYGQIIYSSLLNLGEAYGMERYSRLIANQPEKIRQRIRDFIYYDATRAPKEKRKEVEAGARKSAPDLFPADYIFGSGNPLFTSD